MSSKMHWSIKTYADKHVLYKLKSRKFRVSWLYIYEFLFYKSLSAIVFKEDPFDVIERTLQNKVSFCIACNKRRLSTDMV